AKHRADAAWVAAGKPTAGEVVRARTEAHNRWERARGRIQEAAALAGRSDGWVSQVEFRQQTGGLAGLRLRVRWLWDDVAGSLATPLGDTRFGFERRMYLPVLETSALSAGALVAGAITQFIGLFPHWKLPVVDAETPVAKRRSVLQWWRDTMWERGGALAVTVMTGKMEWGRFSLPDWLDGLVEVTVSSTAAVLLGNVRDSTNWGGREREASSHLGGLPTVRPLVVSVTLLGLVRIDFFLQTFALASLANPVSRPDLKAPKLVGFHPVRWVANRLRLFDLGFSTKRRTLYTFFMSGVGVGPASPMWAFLDVNFLEFRRLGRQVTLAFGSWRKEFDLLLAPGEWLLQGVRWLVRLLLPKPVRDRLDRFSAWRAGRAQRHEVRQALRVWRAARSEIRRQERRLAWWHARRASPPRAGGWVTGWWLWVRSVVVGHAIARLERVLEANRERSRDAIRVLWIGVRSDAEIAVRQELLAVGLDRMGERRARFRTKLARLWGPVLLRDLRGKGRTTTRLRDLKTDIAALEWIERYLERKRGAPAPTPRRRVVGHPVRVAVVIGVAVVIVLLLTGPAGAAPISGGPSGVGSDLGTWVAIGVALVGPLGARVRGWWGRMGARGPPAWLTRTGALLTGKVGAGRAAAVALLAGVRAVVARLGAELPGAVRWWPVRVLVRVAAVVVVFVAVFLDGAWPAAAAGSMRVRPGAGDTFDGLARALGVHPDVLAAANADRFPTAESRDLIFTGEPLV
ncbi:MAG: hypothetical protein ACRDQ0_09270, partial [Pseudonocardia sp.]